MCVNKNVVKDNNNTTPRHALATDTILRHITAADSDFVNFIYI